MIGAGYIGRDLTAKLRGMLSNMHLIALDGGGLKLLGWHVVAAMLAALALPFLFGMIAAVAGNMLQHRPVWSFEALMPKPSRLSPMQGLKRVLGKEALVNFLKGLIKIVVVSLVIGLCSGLTAACSKAWRRPTLRGCCRRPRA